MNKLQENMRRFGTKNLSEQSVGSSLKSFLDLKTNKPADYKLLASGQATADQIAGTILNAVGKYNDDEAVMQSAIAAIKDKMQLAEIEKLLGSNLIKWLNDNFAKITAGVRNAKAIGDYIEDHHENGKTPSIMNSLKRLGILNQMGFGKSLLSGIKTFGFIQKGDYYQYPDSGL